MGHKGARLTTQISLAGRFLVYVPGGSSTGISRKLPDTERKRLKEILREIVPADAGVIIRTAAEGVSEEELSRDVTRLQTQWAAIEEQAAKAKSEASGHPKTLYEEPDLLVKVVRDLFNEDFSKLVIEGDKSWRTVENYIRTVRRISCRGWSSTTTRAVSTCSAPTASTSSSPSARPQGVVAVRWHARHRPHRGHDRRRRQHR